MPEWLFYRPRPESNPASKNGALLCWESGGLRYKDLLQQTKTRVRPEDALLGALKWTSVPQGHPPSHKRTL